MKLGDRLELGMRESEKSGITFQVLACTTGCLGGTGQRN